MTEEQPDLREALKAATKRFEQAERQIEKIREELKELVIAGLKSDIGPAEAARLSPWTATHIREIAKTNGIPPFRPGGAGRKGGRHAAPRRSSS